MTKQYWNERAEEYARKQHEAQSGGDEVKAEFYDNKKRACWAMLPYASIASSTDDLSEVAPTVAETD